jgi:hypothetical protein
MGAPHARTNATVPGRAIFIIATNNTAVHLYPDSQSLVGTRGAEARELDQVEFFNVNGVRLVPVVNGTGDLIGLRDAGTAPDPADVAKRLRLVRQHLADTVDARIAGANPPVSRAEALRRLPNLDGKSLPECYAALERAFSHTYGESGPSPAHNGGWWHNLWAH